jgi:hypothetical protein
MSIPMETIPHTKVQLRKEIEEQMAAFKGKIEQVPYVGDAPVRPKITVMPLNISMNRGRGD